MRQGVLNKRDKGFTLFEVMVAIAIIAIALLAIMRSLSMSVRVTGESKNIFIATMLARGEMARIEGQGFPDVGEEKGDFDEDYSNFRWEKNIGLTEFKELRKVVVTVFWPEGKDERKMELVTYISKR